MAAFQMLAMADGADGLRTILRTPPSPGDFPGDYSGGSSGDSSGGLVTVVTLLAGTNDLHFFGRTAVQASSDLVALHALVHAEGARSVAVEVPRTQRCAEEPGLEAAREAINRALAGLFASGPSSLSVVAAAADAALMNVSDRSAVEAAADATIAVGVAPSGDAVPLEPPASPLAAALATPGPLGVFSPTDASVGRWATGTGHWDKDGLHLSKRGYAALGKGLAADVAALVKSAVGASAGGSKLMSKRRHPPAPSLSLQ